MLEKLVLGDAHTHLNQYGPEEIPGIVSRAEEASVRFIVLAGTTLESTRNCIQMAQDYEIFHAGVGIHPMEAHQGWTTPCMPIWRAWPSTTQRWFA